MSNKFQCFMKYDYFFKKTVFRKNIESKNVTNHMKIYKKGNEKIN